MLKKITITILITVGIFFLFVPDKTAFAKTESEAKEELETEVGKTIDDLELSEFEQYGESLDYLYQAGGVKGFIKEITKGNIVLTPQTLIKIGFEYLTSGLKSILPTLMGIILIAVLFSIVNGLTSEFLNKQTNEIVYFVCYSAIITTVIAMVIGTIRSVKNTIEVLGQIINSVYPPLITLVTAIGGGVTTGLFNPGLAFVSNLVSNVITKVILPLFIASVIFCIVGNLSNNVKLDKLQRATRFIATGILSLTFGGFIAYLSIAGLIGGVTDTASIKATKYLVSSYVPVVGGYLSQGVDLVRVGMVIVKNALGVVGVLAVIGVMLMPVLKLTVLTVGLKVTAGIIEPIGDKRMSGFISGISESTKQLLGAILGSGFVFILTLAIILVTLNAI